ncbi:hypothetical protein SCHPADRAFT_457153 [Schizopora paradoxa]|uniref:Secreted protein n=1 Tax=Schizopora paradoxa TaxID=27342 RepID=A0A0H2RJC1_9AGAM|nr:hypothetical protein SCHPADRAFT_457153 [Schizopora paradoxa]
MATTMVLLILGMGRHTWLAGTFLRTCCKVVCGADAAYALVSGEDTVLHLRDEAEFVSKGASICTSKFRLAIIIHRFSPTLCHQTLPTSLKALPHDLGAFSDLSQPSAVLFRGLFEDPLGNTSINSPQVIKIFYLKLLGAKSKAANFPARRIDSPRRVRHPRQAMPARHGSGEASC